MTDRLSKTDITTIFETMWANATPELKKTLTALIMERVEKSMKEAIESNYGVASEVIKDFVKKIVNEVLEANLTQLKEEVLRQLPLRMESLKMAAIDAAYQAAVTGIAEAIKNPSRR